MSWVSGRILLGVVAGEIVIVASHTLFNSWRGDLSWTVVQIMPVGINFYDPEVNDMHRIRMTCACAACRV